MLFASDWIAFHADRTPERLALCEEDGRRVTYAQLHDRSARLAAFLRDRWDVKRGDRVAILAKNSIAYFEFQFACWKLGAIMLPVNWRLAVPEITYILNDCTPVGLVYDAEFSDRVPALLEAAPSLRHILRIDHTDTPPPDDALSFDEVITATTDHITMPPDLSQSDPAFIMYTSGTSGHPKGALNTHGMVFYNAINISTPTGLNRDSVQYQVLPTFHTAGLNLYVNPLLHWGGSAIIAREFDAGRTLAALSDRDLGVTHFFGVPAIYLFMSQHKGFEGADLSGVTSWGCGGAPLPVAVLERYHKQHGVIIQLGFGMTETSPTVFLIAKRRVMAKPTSVGKPMQYTRVRVVDEGFNDKPVGEVGEVVIGGPNITPGYWNNDEANAKAFTTDDYGIRWIHSGDAGKVDEDGCVYIVDRYKDMYISGGENVYPAEVEQVIFQREEIADVAVIGVPDDKWGESGLAVIVAAAEVDREALIAHCRTNLARYKVPRGIAFLDELPRNAAGKVLKRVLREQYAQGKLTEL